MNIEDRAYRIKRGEQRAVQEARTEAAVQRTILIVAAVILAAYFFVIYLLIKGLFFGKSKSTRIFSALGLVAIAIGTTVLVKHIRHKYMDDHTPKTPMALYLEMDEQSFRAQCGSFLDSSQMGLVTPNVRTNLATILVFRDKLRSMGVSEDAFKESYESGGFEGLFQDKVAKRIVDPYYLVELHTLSDLKTALDKCLSCIDAPEWKLQELKIRASLYFYLREEKNLFDAIMRSAERDGDSRETVMRIFEATEIVRVLRALKIMGQIRLNSDSEPPSSSADCAEKIVKDYCCQGIAKKWILELGNWCIAWNLPNNAPNSITFLVSLGFPYDDITPGRSVNDPIELTHPFVLVHKDGEIKNIYTGEDYTLRKLFDEKELLRDLTQLKYLTPRGILTPFAVEQSVVREPSERKSENAETRSMKTEEPISSPTIPEAKTSKVEDAPVEPSPVVPSRSQAEPKPQAVVPSEKSPHFKDAKKHDWQALSQKEWRKTFSGIQKIFSVFGGFQLAQPPIDGIEFDTSGYHGSENFQRDVPLQKKYRYFQKADLEFLHGALVGFTLKTHFAKKYSRASIDREYKAFKDDVVKNLKTLHRPELGVSVGTMPPFPVRYGESRSPSAHNILGTINTTYYLRQTDDGYDLTMTVNAKDGLRRFIELVLKNKADEAGDELEDFDTKHQGKVNTSSDDENELEEQKRLEAQKRNEAQYERALAQMNQREKAAKDKLGRQYKMRMIKYNYYSAEFDKITNDYKKYRENLRIKYGIDKNE